jgi:hypothetical protein
MRKLFTLLLLGYVAYQGYDAWSIRQDAAFQVAQTFIQAVSDKDSFTQKRLGVVGYALEDQAVPFNGQKRWSYERLLSHTMGAKHDRVMRINQLVRYDPKGQNTFFGEQSLSLLHTLTLESQGGDWKVKAYEVEPY